MSVQIDAAKGNMLKRVTEMEKPAAHFGFRITSVWQLEDSDPPEGSFDSEIIFLIPPNKREWTAIQGKLEYAKGAFLARMVAEVIGPPPIDGGSGLLTIRNRIK